MKNSELYERFGPFGKDMTLVDQRFLSGLSASQSKAFYERAATIHRAIQEQQQTGSRPKPSSTLVSIGDQPDRNIRVIALDTAAQYADSVAGEGGRSQQCVVFAAVVRAVLEMGGKHPKLMIGRAQYQQKDARGRRFEWDHAWLELGGDIIDGNVDSLHENPMVPAHIQVPPYWGPRKELRDRVLTPRRALAVDREALEIDLQFPEERRRIQVRLVEMAEATRRQNTVADAPGKN